MDETKECLSNKRKYITVFHKFMVLIDETKSFSPGVHLRILF